MKPTRRSVVLVFVLGLFACSDRTRSACVGHSPEVTPAGFDEVLLHVEHEKNVPGNGNWPDSPDFVYAALSVTMALPNVKDEPCKSVPEKTTLSLGGRGMVMVSRGAGTNKLVSRSSETTTCGALRAQVASAELLGGPATGPETFTMTSGGDTLTVTFAPGRPKATVSADKREVVVEIVGLDGKIVDASSSPVFSAWSPGAKEGQVLVQKAREGNKLRLDASKLEGKTFTLLGDVRLEPKATCAPAKKRCAVSVRYGLRLPLQMP